MYFINNLNINYDGSIIYSWTTLYCTLGYTDLYSIEKIQNISLFFEKTKDNNTLFFNFEQLQHFENKFINSKKYIYNKTFIYKLYINNGFTYSYILNLLVIFLQQKKLYSIWYLKYKKNLL